MAADRPTVRRETLTPYRRDGLYERAMEWATADEPIDGDADEAHLLIHALAKTPDGPLEVREDYLDEDAVPESEHTDQERISGWIEFYGMPPVDPALYETDEALDTLTAVVTLRAETNGTPQDLEDGLRARLDEVNGGAGDTWVYPEVLSVDVQSSGQASMDRLQSDLDAKDRSLTQAEATALFDAALGDRRSAPRGHDAGDDSPAGAGHSVEADRE